MTNSTYHYNNYNNNYNPNAGAAAGNPSAAQIVRVGDKVYPLVNQLSPRTVEMLTWLLKEKRVVLGPSVFRLLNVPLINAFFMGLFNLLKQLGCQVIVVEETMHELEHLASRQPVSDTVELARAGLYWFKELERHRLLKVEPRLCFADNRPYNVHPNVATLFRLSQAMLLNREAGGAPFALITSSRDEAEDVSLLLSLNTVIKGLDYRGVSKPELFYVDKYGSVTPYKERGVGAQEPMPRVNAGMPADRARPVSHPPVAAAAGVHGSHAPRGVHAAGIQSRTPSRPPQAQAQADRGPTFRGRLTDIPDEVIELKKLVTGAKLKSSDGGMITLGEYLDGGAEGSIYQVKDQPYQVAKVFERISKRKAEKIRRLQGKQISGVTMPLSVLTNSDGQLCGYTMTKVDNAIPMTELFDKLRRSRKAPEWNRKDFVDAARCIAQIGSELARAGILPTDGNMENILVCRDRDGYLNGARIVLIDVDAFQVDTAQVGNGPDVGVIPGDGFSDEILPLMDVMTTQTIYSESDYAYMLAIQTFMVLMGGIHPFQQMPDPRFPDRTLNQLSQQGLFPYGYGMGAGAIAATMAKPLEQWSTRFSLMMPDAQKLFAEFFSVNSKRREAFRRPTIGELREVLSRYCGWVVSAGTDPRARELEPAAKKPMRSAA